MGKRYNEPKDTCPTINQAIQLLQSICRDELEDIRSANIELREWGSDGWDMVDELETEIDRLKELLDAAEIDY